MGASPSRPTPTASSSNGASSGSQLSEKRVESVTESMATLTVQSKSAAGKPLSADGSINVENLEQWESEISEVRTMLLISKGYSG